MVHLSLAALGPLRIELNGAPLSAFDKVQGLLVYLAVESGTAHRRDTLAGLFWPEQSETAARNNLRVSLYRLRKAIGDTQSSAPFLQVTNTTVGFNLASDHRLDAAVFQALLQAARPKTGEPDLSRLAEAAALYRGDFLQGFFLEDSAAFEAWALMVRERLHRQALEALSQLTTYHLAQGAYPAAQRYAHRQLELEPWREEAHRQLMLALTFSGQRNMALTQYETCRALLTTNLGVEPAPETEALFERIRSGSLGPLARDAAVLEGPAAAAPPGPSPRVPFVGREAERTRIATCFQAAGCRLLTLTGPAGIGKTRLAIQAAVELAAHYRHGTALVPLAPLAAPEFMAAALSLALRLPRSGAPLSLSSLLEHLRDRDMLLILDGPEHLLAAPVGSGRGQVVRPQTAALITHILEAAPRIHVLVTSHRPLGLAAEKVLPLGGLPFPAHASPRSADQAGEAEASADELESYGAVRLFVEHARRVQPSFGLSPANWPAVARLCQLADGNPQVIALAAAWAGEFECEAIAAGIESRLGYLTADLEVPQRPAALAAAFEYAWQHITSGEQRQLRQLSVFAGGFRAEAAQAVAEAAPGALVALAATALLVAAGPDRYDLAPGLRSLAAEKLRRTPEEMEGARDRHGAYYAALLQLHAGALGGDRPDDVLAAEVDNLRQAWRRAAESGNAPLLNQAMDGLWRLYELLGWYQEGEAAMWHAAAGLGAGDEAEPARLPSPRAAALAKALMYQGLFTWRLEKYAPAEALLKASLAKWHDLKAPLEAADVLEHLAALSARQGDYAAAARYYEECVTICRRAGDQAGVARYLDSLAGVAITLGNYVDARRAGGEALALSRAADDAAGAAAALGTLGGAALAAGEYAEARRVLEESLVLHTEAGNRPGLATVLSLLGEAALRANEHAQALDHLRRGLALSRQTGARAAAAACLQHLSELACLQGHAASARAYAYDALVAGQAARALPRLLSVLVTAALVLARQAQAEQALEVLAVVIDARLTGEAERARAAQWRAKAAEDLPPEIVASAQARGLEMGLQGVIQAVEARLAPAELM